MGCPRRADRLPRHGHGRAALAATPGHYQCRAHEGLIPRTYRGSEGRPHQKAHYTGGHAARPKGVRRRAYLDATTRCRRCGLTLEERRVTHPAETWDAGHVVPGQVNGELVPEHSSCNRSAGVKAMLARYSGYDW